MGGLYFCAGIWVNRDNEYIKIFEELGHYLCFHLGLENSSSGPTSNHSIKSSIPLLQLEYAFTLFNEELGSCSGAASPIRCPGFLGYAGNYDATGREHNFLYTIY